MDRRRLEIIGRISPYAITEEGTGIRPLKEQRELQQMTYEWTHDAALSRKPFVVLENGSELGIDPLRHKPVVIRHRDIKHIFKRHAEDGQERLSYTDINERLEKLDDELRNHVLAFDDPARNNHVCIALGKLSRGGNELIAVIDSQASIATFNVADIVTVHGRNDLLARIESTLQSGKHVYPNQRTSAWLESSAEHPRETTKRLREIVYQLSQERAN